MWYKIILLALCMGVPEMIHDAARRMREWRER